MPKKKWHWDQERDRFLVQHYDPAVRGRSQWIARRLGVPRWAVNRRAAALGLSHTKDRPWTPEEEEYLESSYHRISLKTLARKLGRTPTAVRLKAKRLRLRKHGEGYSACSLAQALGVDPHWVLARIRSGKLRATHRQTERTEAQGGDSWLITEEAVVSFVREYPYELDLRRVDRLWFLDLVSTWLRDPTARASGRNGTGKRPANSQKEVAA
jgi:biotin operon repressor